MCTSMRNSILPAGDCDDPFAGNDSNVKTSELTEIQKLRIQNSQFRHDLFYLWVYLCYEDELESALSFLWDHESDPLPPGMIPYDAFTYDRG